MTSRSLDTIKLGRIKSPVDDRDLRAARYIAAVPDPPSRYFVSNQATWAMFLNDRLGDCTSADAAHLIQVWTAATTGHRAKITNAQVEKFYSATSGYVPGDESTDNGANERDVLKYWLANGFAGHSIAAFAAVEPLDNPLSITRMRNIKQALWVFGGLYLGLDLPLSAQTQITKGQVWDVTGGPDAVADSWGGHAVNAIGYDADGISVVTWGRKQLMTWAFVSAYCSELWAVVSPDWLKSGKSPSGFDMATLQADLTALRAA